MRARTLGADERERDQGGDDDSMAVHERSKLRVQSQAGEVSSAVSDDLKAIVRKRSKASPTSDEGRGSCGKRSREPIARAKIGQQGDGIARPSPTLTLTGSDPLQAENRSHQGYPRGAIEPKVPLVRTESESALLARQEWRVWEESC